MWPSRSCQVILQGPAAETWTDQLTRLGQPASTLTPGMGRMGQGQIAFHAKLASSCTEHEGGLQLERLTWGSAVGKITSSHWMVCRPKHDSAGELQARGTQGHYSLVLDLTREPRVQASQ